ncbi:MAG: hypothetical protein LBE91_12135 [Tannerella sp.]|jgi:hypothetical protein|nr:hypothetical protein [Tannerella sp.]
MKTYRLFFILPALLLVFTGCSNNSDSMYSNENQPCHCIVDSLKGEWSWIKTYGGFFGNITENEFKSTLKVYSQNEDASINYEIFVEDTLFYRGGFQVQYAASGLKRNMTNMRLPHYLDSGQEWVIGFGDMMTGILDGNILCFWDGGMDGYFYYYQKIRKEK